MTTDLVAGTQAPSFAIMTDNAGKISSASLPVILLVDVDRYPHAFVEPSAVCPREHYQENLWGTRLSWSRTHA